jgi:hypothetical protein
MDTFFVRFKSVIAAVAMVAAIEIAIFFVHPSTFVERSNYLDWNYGTPELFQKGIIYEKLNIFAHSAPDIVMVGDSTALHNVDPDVVSSYLGGLKLVNLGSIANAGFDGFYAMADFMFRRNPNIKALVLYVSLNHLPNASTAALLIGDSVTGGAQRIAASFTSPWAYINPPSMGLRPVVTDAVYSGLGTLRPRQTTVLPAGGIWGDMLISVREHNGWWPEHDLRFAGPRLRDFWSQFCSDNGVRMLDDSDANYEGLLFFGKRSYLRLSLQSFIDLAKRHGAKFVVMFQPNPCSKWIGSYLPARRADLEYLRNHNANFSFEPESVFEHWPMEDFSSYDHLRVGYDLWGSERAGRLLASALGIPGLSQKLEFPGGPIAPSVNSALREILGPQDNVHRFRRIHGVEVAACHRCTGSGRSFAGAVEISEVSKIDVHAASMPIGNVEMGATYFISATAKIIGDRQLSIDVPDAGSSDKPASVDCNVKELEARRGLGAADAGMDMLSGGWFRCWAVITVPDDRARLRVAILDKNGQSFYAGGGGAILLKHLTLKLASPLHEVAPGHRVRDQEN